MRKPKFWQIKKRYFYTNQVSPKELLAAHLSKESSVSAAYPLKNPLFA